jgi:type I site-specific restriction endonuclease
MGFFDSLFGTQQPVALTAEDRELDTYCQELQTLPRALNLSPDQAQMIHNLRGMCEDLRKKKAQLASDFSTVRSIVRQVESMVMAATQHIPPQIRDTVRKLKATYGSRTRRARASRRRQAARQARARRRHGRR